MPAATDNMRLATKVAKQAVVYWAAIGVDDFGSPEYDDPIQINCRWEDVSEEFIDPNGDREISRAKLIVDRDLTLKGVVWLGALVDVRDAADPKANDGAWEIRMVKKTPDIRAKRFLREVIL